MISADGALITMIIGIPSTTIFQFIFIGNEHGLKDV